MVNLLFLEWIFLSTSNLGYCPLIRLSLLSMCLWLPLYLLTRLQFYYLLRQRLNLCRCNELVERIRFHLRFRISCLMSYSLWQDCVSLKEDLPQYDRRKGLFSAFFCDALKCFFKNVFILLIYVSIVIFLATFPVGTILSEIL